MEGTLWRRRLRRAHAALEAAQTLPVAVARPAVYVDAAVGEVHHQLVGEHVLLALSGVRAEQQPLRRLVGHAGLVEVVLALEVAKRVLGQAAEIAVGAVQVVELMQAALHALHFDAFVAAAHRLMVDVEGIGLEKVHQAVGNFTVRHVGRGRGRGRHLRRQCGVVHHGHLARRGGRRGGGGRRGRGRRRGVGLQVFEHLVVLVALEGLHRLLGVVAVMAVHRAGKEAPLGQPLLGQLDIHALGAMRARRGRGRGLDGQIRAVL